MGKAEVSVKEGWESRKKGGCLRFLRITSYAKYGPSREKGGLLWWKWMKLNRTLMRKKWNSRLELLMHIPNHFHMTGKYLRSNQN